jgi:hypothetical protein
MRANIRTVESGLPRYLGATVVVRAVNDGASVGLGLLALTVRPAVAGALVAALVAPHLLGPWLSRMLSWTDSRYILAGSFTLYGVSVAAVAMVNRGLGDAYRSAKARGLQHRHHNSSDHVGARRRPAAVLAVGTRLARSRELRRCRRPGRPDGGVLRVRTQTLSRGLEVVTTVRLPVTLLRTNNRFGH